MEHMKEDMLSREMGSRILDEDELVEGDAEGRASDWSEVVTR